MPFSRSLILLTILTAGLCGCGPSKSDNASNPELQVPDVPPSTRTTQSPIPPAK